LLDPLKSCESYFSDAREISLAPAQKRSSRPNLRRITHCFGFFPIWEALPTTLR
jgi:hypothetical protein